MTVHFELYEQTRVSPVSVLSTEIVVSIAPKLLKSSKVNPVKSSAKFGKVYTSFPSEVLDLNSSFSDIANYLVSSYRSIEVEAEAGLSKYLPERAGPVRVILVVDERALVEK